MNDKQNEPLIESPEIIIDEITQELEKLHLNVIQGAEQIGQVKSEFSNLRPRWVIIGNSSTADPDEAELYNSAIGTLLTYKDYFHNLNQQYIPIQNQIGQLFVTSASATALTETTDTSDTHVSVGLNGSELAIALIMTSTKRANTILMLEKLSKPLADTYREMLQVLLGTKSDPERGALFLIRQVYDHLFTVLAPDELVRKSQFWKPKEAPFDEDEVFRPERIQYAAETRVDDPFLKRTLIAQTNHIQKVYKVLNGAHNRGKLKKQKSIKAIKEMETIIESWLIAINLENPL